MWAIRFLDGNWMGEEKSLVTWMISEKCSVSFRGIFDVFISRFNTI